MALAILPSHPSPVPYHHSAAHRSFLSVAMDQPPQARPSLPPISSLIHAMNERVQQCEKHPLKFACQPLIGPTAKLDHSSQDHPRRTSAGSQGSTSPDQHSISGTPRSRPPPTPELPPTSSFDFQRPRETRSPTSPNSRSAYPPTPASSTNPELYAQRLSYPPVPETNSYPPIPEPHQWPTPPAHPRTASDPSPQDVARAAAAATPPAENGQVHGLSQQRPLPANFPPSVSAQGLPPIDPQMAPTWQHHHYYPPTNPPSYPQTQERYICPTCSKPFSRPSSLKIHTYSHTGEKPYKCKHDGCGKHFSVRSNMKRHEKGCHGGDDASSPKTA